MAMELKSGKPRWTLVILLALLTALDAMAIDTYLPAMPHIADELEVSAGKIQQTLSIFLGGLALGQALYGPLLDRFGRRLPLLAGIGVFAAGSGLAALAANWEWLMAARFLQAIGASAGLVTPRAIITDICGITESAQIFSLLMQVMMIAPILAPVAGSFLLGHGGWRLIFSALAVLAVAGIVWCWRVIPDSLPRENRVELNLRTVLEGYAALIRSAAFMAYTIAGGFILGSLFVYISGSAFVFTRYFALPPTLFSFLFASNSLVLVLGGQISAMLLKRGSSEQGVMYAGIAVHTAAGLVLAALVQANIINFWSYAALVATALGALGLVFGNLTALTMSSAEGRAGAASSFMGSIQYLLSALIGYGVSVLAQSLAQLPFAIAVCGMLSAILCFGAGHAAER